MFLFGFICGWLIFGIVGVIIDFVNRPIGYQFLKLSETKWVLLGPITFFLIISQLGSYKKIWNDLCHKKTWKNNWKKIWKNTLKNCLCKKFYEKLSNKIIFKTKAYKIWELKKQQDELEYNNKSYQQKNITK